VATRAEVRARAQTRVRWELLANLIRKDLKVKYQGSTLGFLWSLANPLLLLAVYSFVFGVVFKSPVPYFGIYLMTGLLIWSAFQGAVQYACGSVVASSGLVKKVRFPTQVLPLSSVGFAAVHFVLQMLVLVVVMAVVRFDFLGWQLLLVIPATALAVLFALGLGYLVAALNVRYRDTQHLVEVIMIAWFWLNPVIYSVALIKTHLHEWYWTYFLNPMATVVTTYQRAIYKITSSTDSSGVKHEILGDAGYAFYARNLAIGFAIAGVLFWYGRRVFHRLAADFAEEL
jgi:ABC-2 type transport system permease protein